MTTLSELKLACISLPAVFHLCANASYILRHDEFSVHSMHVAVCLLCLGGRNLGGIRLSSRLCVCLSVCVYVFHVHFSATDKN